ncbi:MAG: DUF5777 family beta-barrel protein [Bacteroidia bacterium]|nr:DUF5777 family beta-barrel protein [Bacteroidia bacterium]
MKTRKNILLFRVIFSVMLVVSSFRGFSQDAGDDGKKPVRDMYSCTMLGDNQTTINPVKGAFELLIQHRFGQIKQLTDLYGIYAPSNIRVGFDYGLSDKVMVGFGTEKNNKLQEFDLKWAIHQQNRDGSMPVSVSLFVNTAIDARSKDAFGSNYDFTHRFTYFSELIIARKFNDILSLQIAPNFSHFNSVDSLYEHDVIGTSIGGRIKFYNEMSLIFEYDQPFNIKGLHESLNPLNPYKPDMVFGFEVATSTHTFQVFATTADNIVAQKNYAYNSKEFKDLMLGFNLTVRL